MKHVAATFGKSYRPQRVLGISKLSALEFLKIHNPELNENQLLDRLKRMGKDPQKVLDEHRTQLVCEEDLAKTLRKLHINYRIMKRIGDASKCVDWADLIISIGGDGTFLLASKLIKNNEKSIVGINPRLDRVNNFTLPSEYTANMERIFERLRIGEYDFLMRSRIQTVMNGEGLYRQPFHVHEKSRTRGERRIDALVRSTQRKIADALQPRQRTLPWLALNEVFMGEFLAARATTLTVRVDNQEEYTIRSSGICVCTGSGSRSWFKSMNVRSPETVRKIVTIATGDELNEKELNQLLQRYHKSLEYSPDDQRMTCMIREMHRTSRCPKPKCCPERQMCRKVKVKSGGFDAGLVLDGSVSLPFNDGTTAVFDIQPQYALKNIVFR